MIPRNSKLRAFGASATGTSHTERTIPCQDFFCQEWTPAGDWIAVVADGAGSASRAALGSQMAAESALTSLYGQLCEQPNVNSDELDKALLLSATRARSTLEAAARAENVSLSYYATTLIVICVTRSWIGALQIGDGGIVLRNRYGITGLFISPVRGGHINETDFLTMDHFSRYLRTKTTDAGPVTGISAFTDGVEFLSVGYFNCIPSNQFFDPLFRFAESPESTVEELDDFLHHHEVFNKIDDDKTLVLAAII